MLVLAITAEKGKSYSVKNKWDKSEAMYLEINQDGRDEKEKE